MVKYCHFMSNQKLMLAFYDLSGTWRNELVCSSHHVMPIPADTPIITAATLRVNGCTAYRMLHDFVQLSKGKRSIGIIM